MKQAKERILYQNYELDYDGAKEWLIENHLEEYPDEVEWEPTEQEIYDEAYFLDGVYWGDFEANFKNFFDSHTFILQGTIGTWRGKAKGGYIFDSFNELSKAWDDCEYVKIYDENGHLYIKCSHHDGTNHYEIRMLNEKGYDYADRHYYDDEEEVHDKLMKNPYSVLPDVAHIVYGCPKREYIDKI